MENTLGFFALSCFCSFGHFNSHNHLLWVQNWPFCSGSGSVFDLETSWQLGKNGKLIRRQLQHPSIRMNLSQQKLLCYRRKTFLMTCWHIIGLFGLQELYRTLQRFSSHTSHSMLFTLEPHSRSQYTHIYTLICILSQSTHAFCYHSLKHWISPDYC